MRILVAQQNTHRSSTSVPDDDDDGEGAAKLHNRFADFVGGIQTCVVCEY